MRGASDKAKYDVALQYYRDHGRNHSGASRAAGVTPPTAQKYYEIGILALELPPIREVLTQFAIEARKRIDDAAARERLAEEKERRLRPLLDAGAKHEDAIQRRERNAALIAGQKGSVQAMIVASGRALRAAIARMGDFEKAFGAMELANGDQALRYLRTLHDLGSLVVRAGDAFATLQKAEHLELGEPTSILSVRPAEVTPEQAEARLELALSAIRTAREAEAKVAAEEAAATPAPPGPPPSAPLPAPVVSASPSPDAPLPSACTAPAAVEPGPQDHPPPPEV